MLCALWLGDKRVHWHQGTSHEDGASAETTSPRRQDPIHGTPTPTTKSACETFKKKNWNQKLGKRQEIQT